MFQDMLAELDRQCAGQPGHIPAFRQTHDLARERLAELFHEGSDITELVHAGAELVDGLLQRAWKHFMAIDAAAALVAVGGYGRGELLPGSDVDLLILTDTDPQELAHCLEPLIMFLWDIGLEVGHSVRSVEQCIEEARGDLTVITNLIESRPLAGQEELFERMSELTSVDHIWPSDAFFSSKLAEQQARHDNSGGSSHDLEPNVKSDPGGLRDIQTIGWVAKRHFNADTLFDLVGHGFLTEQEFDELVGGERFLWRVRFALHVLTGRREDRLLFEYQRKLAKQFGYSDANTNLAVEQFMQLYYRTVVRLQRLNEMLLQLFNETILLKNALGEPRPINRRFQARGDSIEVINPAVFARAPLTLLEVFLLLQQHPELKGVRASTIRSIRAHRHLVDARLRNSISARSLFMEILRQPRGITQALRRMHRYGILERYIPAFQAINGLMQFDLFHLYTVDEHILMVVRNLRRFSLKRFTSDCGLCYSVFHSLPKPELLYLSGLFHDIAKGRGGDHSRLGAKDAYDFCQAHHLSEYDSQLVAWLVEKHLVMSATAQRQDIDDPEVIHQFAGEVGTVERLDYLYLLTGADMRGTNPERWNSWKASLIDRLYRRTRQALESGQDQPQDEDQLIGRAQELAREQLRDSGISEQEMRWCWMQLSTEYFLQTSPAAIAWHTRLLLEHPQHAQIRVYMRDGATDMPPPVPLTVTQAYIHEDAERGCSEIFTFGPDRDGLFAETTALLDQMAINILGARIDASAARLSFNSYFVLEEDGAAITQERHDEIVQVLFNELNRDTGRPPAINRRMPRHLKSFMCDTIIGIEQHETHNMTVLTVITHDRPGLLSLIGSTLAEQKMRLHSASIVTEGAIARDRFTFTDRQDQPITDNTLLEKLREALLKTLDG